MNKYKLISFFILFIFTISTPGCIIYYQNQCSQCNQTYYLTTNYTCLPCPNGCIQCISNNICSTCFNNYYLLDNVCQPGPNNCLNVLNNGDC